MNDWVVVVITAMIILAVLGGWGAYLEHRWPKRKPLSKDEMRELAYKAKMQRLEALNERYEMTLRAISNWGYVEQAKYGTDDVRDVARSALHKEHG